MQKVDHFSMPPSVCFICTAAPNEPVCDTFIDFDPGVQTPRNGRIYVCASCAQTTADALGLFDASKERVSEAEAKVTEIEKRMEAYEAIAAAIEVVRPAPTPEPTITAEGSPPLVEAADVVEIKAKKETKPEPASEPVEEVTDDDSDQTEGADA